MRMRIFAVIGIGAGCVLQAAGDTKERVQVSHTEHLDFPVGGNLRLTSASAMVTVEGWDRPEVEITSIKSTTAAYLATDRDKGARILENVHIVTRRQGDELVIGTDTPKHWRASGPAGFELEYRIKAPSTVRLIATLGAGDVNVDGLVRDIEVTLHRGQILVRVPEQALYRVDASCAVGNVSSNLAGEEKRRWWLIGHRFADGSSQEPHQLHLKVGAGDIVILKSQVPKRADGPIR